VATLGLDAFCLEVLQQSQSARRDTEGGALQGAAKGARWNSMQAAYLDVDMWDFHY